MTTAASSAILLTIVVALAACQPTGETATTSTPIAGRAAPGTLPSSVRVAGEPAAVNDVVRGLRAEGLDAVAYPVGRAEGLRIICSGGGEVLALMSDLIAQERTACSDLGMTWSVGDLSDRIVYVDYFWSENLFRQMMEL